MIIGGPPHLLGEGICIQADEDHGCYPGAFLQVQTGRSQMNPRNRHTKQCLPSRWKTMHTHVLHETGKQVAASFSFMD